MRPQTSPTSVSRSCRERRETSTNLCFLFENSYVLLTILHLSLESILYIVPRLLHEPVLVSLVNTIILEEREKRHSLTSFQQLYNNPLELNPSVILQSPSALECLALLLVPVDSVGIWWRIVDEMLRFVEIAIE